MAPVATRTRSNRGTRVLRDAAVSTTLVFPPSVYPKTLSLRWHCSRARWTCSCSRPFRGVDARIEITTWLEERSGGRLSIVDAALLQALHRMEERNLIAAEWGVTQNARRARYYRLTPTGRVRLRRVGGIGRPRNGARDGAYRYDARAMIGNGDRMTREPEVSRGIRAGVRRLFRLPVRTRERARADAGRGARRLHRSAR